jgi:hypothetical protein
VGNQIFADYVDVNANLTRITNKYVYPPGSNSFMDLTGLLEKTQCLPFPDVRLGSFILREKDIFTRMELGSTVLGKITQSQGVL